MSTSHMEHGGCERRFKCHSKPNFAWDRDGLLRRQSGVNQVYEGGECGAELLAEQLQRSRIREDEDREGKRVSSALCQREQWV